MIYNYCRWIGPINLLGWVEGRQFGLWLVAICRGKNVEDLSLYLEVFDGNIEVAFSISVLSPVSKKLNITQGKFLLFFTWTICLGNGE